MRPGISNKMLARAGVRRVSAEEAATLCNLNESGLWLPYRDLDGNAVRDGDKDYGRLRLEAAQGKKKYHQCAGTTVHAYLPPTLNDTKETGGDLHVIEGEFKATSLMEAGFPSVGISGFFGFALPNRNELVPELAAVIARLQPRRILKMGMTGELASYSRDGKLLAFGGDWSKWNRVGVSVDFGSKAR